MDGSSEDSGGNPDRIAMSAAKDPMHKGVPKPHKGAEFGATFGTGDGHNFGAPLAKKHQPEPVKFSASELDNLVNLIGKIEVSASTTLKHMVRAPGIIKLMLL